MIRRRLIIAALAASACLGSPDFFQAGLDGGVRLADGGTAGASGGLGGSGGGSAAGGRPDAGPGLLGPRASRSSTIALLPPHLVLVNANDPNLFVDSRPVIAM